MSAEEAKPDAGSSGTPGGGGGSKLVVILSGVNLLLTLGMAGILFTALKKEQQKVSVDDINPNEEHASGEAKEGEKAAGGEHGGGGGGEHGAEAAAGGHGGEAKGHGGGDSDFAKMVTLEEFTVNLSTIGTANPKFARVNISIEVSSDETHTEITQRMPQVRNIIIDLFNTKRPSDVATPNGRNYLKEEIRNAINQYLVSGKVKQIYFTSIALTS